MTREVVGSQAMPCHWLQQSLPDQVSKIPKYGSESEDFKERRALRSEGGQEETVTARVEDIRKKKKVGIVGSVMMAGWLLAVEV